MQKSLKGVTGRSGAEGNMSQAIKNKELQRSKEVTVVVLARCRMSRQVFISRVQRRVQTRDLNSWSYLARKNSVIT